MRFSGYDLNLDVITQAQGETFLSASFYTIPVVDAIRSASINRTQLLFGSQESEPGQVFNRRPSSSLVEAFSADNVRGLSEQMSLKYDVDGDGRNDALYITENGTLAAKAIDTDLTISDDAFWEYVAPRTVFEFEVLSLNADERPDYIATWPDNHASGGAPLNDIEMNHCSEIHEARFSAVKDLSLPAV